LSGELYNNGVVNINETGVTANISKFVAGTPILVQELTLPGMDFKIPDRDIDIPDLSDHEESIREVQKKMDGAKIKIEK
jgi:hypothetical protein